MNKLTTHIKEELFSIIMLVGELIFYLFFAIYDGAAIYADSASYIEMSFARDEVKQALLGYLY